MLGEIPQSSLIPFSKPWTFLQSLLSRGSSLQLPSHRAHGLAGSSAPLWIHLGAPQHSEPT